MRTVTAADANRHFSKLLRDVASGETVIVTSRGTPVARIEPADAGAREAEEREREQAWRDFLEHLRTRPVLNAPITWTRDDLYDADF